MADPPEKFSWPLNFVEGGLITYTVPALLANRTLSAATNDKQIDPFVITCLTAFTLRLSRLHHEKRLPTQASSRWSGNDADWRIFNFISRRSPSLDLGTLLDLSSLCCGSTIALRKDLTWVGGISHASAWLVPPPSSALPALLDDMATFFRGELDRADPSELSEALLYQLIHIHPLRDGNGRTARALLTWLAKHRASLAPLSLTWLSITDKQAIGRSWSSNERAPMHDVISATTVLQDSIEDLCSELERIERKTEANSLRKAVELSFCIGPLDLGLLVKNLGVSQRLAIKITSTMEDLGWRKEGPLWENVELESLLSGSYLKFSQSLKGQLV